MIYELREYLPLPGKMSTLSQRFANHTVGFFKKYGIEVVGFWTEEIGSASQLVYMLKYDDLGEKEKRWNAFQADPEWQKLRAESEKDGPLVAEIHNRILRPTSFSPSQ